VADQPSVIVGVDGSLESEAALEWAVRLAAPLGWRVVAVHAVGLLEGGGYRPRTDAVGLVEGVRRRLDGVADVPVEEIVEAGHPAETIVRVAERERGALIVVGSRGLGEAPRLLGSTSEAVLAHTHAPVLIVPRPDLPAPHHPDAREEHRSPRPALGGLTPRPSTSLTPPTERH
jgi:nucleotide-binding universal stress UspA family protein